MTFAGLWFEGSQEEEELLSKLLDLSEINKWPLSTTIKRGLAQFVQEHYPNFPPSEPNGDEDDED